MFIYCIRRNIQIFKNLIFTITLVLRIYLLSRNFLFPLVHFLYSQNREHFFTRNILEDQNRESLLAVSSYSVTACSKYHTCQILENSHRRRKNLNSILRTHVMMFAFSPNQLEGKRWDQNQERSELQ